jgi:CheY-like chemotaxis protein
MLTNAGFSVTTAQDGEEALRIARHDVPDLIVRDVLLPKLGGEEVLKALKMDRPSSIGAFYIFAVYSLVEITGSLSPVGSMSNDCLLSRVLTSRNIRSQGLAP